MKKRFLTMIIVAALGLNLVGCGSSGTKAKAESNGGSNQTAAEGSGEAADSEGRSPIKIAAVYSGNLDDKSYNDSCSAGTQQAAKGFGVEAKNLEGTAIDEWEANLPAYCEGGYDLVICSNSNFQKYLEEYKDSYPSVRLTIIDTAVKRPNVVSISPTQNQGSFPAGAVTAMSTTHFEIRGVNDDAVIDWVGDQGIPVPHDFHVGFEQGAEYINPDITVLRSYAGTWTDPLKGKELTLAQYEQGADVVTNAASGTGTGALEAAKEAGKYAIGVDLDQDNDQSGHVVAFMVKRVNTACYNVIESVVEGNLRGDTISYLEIFNDGVDLADFTVIKEYLGDKFSTDTQDKVQELKDKVISGEIVVDSYEGFDKDAR